MPAKIRLVVQTIKNATVVSFADSSLVDMVHIDQVGRELHDLIDRQDRRKIAIDLSKVVHLSSAVLTVFISLQKKMEAVKGELVLCGMSKPIHKLFKISKLHRLFTFAADEDAALEKLGVIMA